MSNEKLSQKSSITKPIQTKFAKTVLVIEDQPNNQSMKPRSRFHKPMATQQSVKYTQGDHENVQANQTQFSEYNNSNLAVPLNQDEKTNQVSQIKPSTFFQMDDIRIKYLQRKQNLLNPQLIQKPDRVDLQSYQVSAFIYPYLENKQSRIKQSRISQVQILNLPEHEEIKDNDFQQTHDVHVSKSKLLYEVDFRNIVYNINLGRQDPLIFIEVDRTGIQREEIIHYLCQQLQMVQQRQKEDQSNFEQLQKELCKYSVVAQIKQIIDKTYIKTYDKLNNIYQSLVDIQQQLNDLLILTEGIQDKVDQMEMNKMIDYISQASAQLKQDEHTIRIVVYYSEQIVCKYLEIYEEQMTLCQNFLINFINNVDQVTILYQFVTSKKEKMYLKLNRQINEFNLVQLPFSEYKQQNEEIIQGIYKYILKQKQKKQYMLKNLYNQIFISEQVQSLDYLETIKQFCSYRNHIIRNPAKFNYEVIKKRPFFILQQFKLQFSYILRLYVSEHQIEEYFHQIFILEKINEFFFQIENIEKQLLIAQEQRQIIRLQSGQLLEQEQFRDLVVEMRTVLDQVLKIQNIFHEQHESLPLAAIKLKNWIQTEVSQCFNVLKILNNKLHSIDVLSSQMDEKTAQQVIEKCQIQLQDINKLIVEEYNPSVFDGPQKQLSKIQQDAIKEIHHKYLSEDETRRYMLTVVEICHNLIEKITYGKDSLLIKMQTQVTMTQLYSQMTEYTQKFQIWEHMIAVRYLMNQKLLCNVIENIHNQIKGQHTIYSILKKLQEQQSFFEMNAQNQQSLQYKNHISDGVFLLTYLKDNYEQYQQLAYLNIASPGSVDIGQSITQLNNQIQSLFKGKSCSINQMYNALQRSIQIYINQTKLQFEDSTKAAELDAKFGDAQNVLNDSQQVFESGSAKFDGVYELGTEAIKQDAQKKKAMNFEAFKINLGFEEQIQQMKKKANDAFAMFNDYKDKLNLKSLPLYQQKLDQKIQEFQALIIAVDLFEKSIYCIYLNCIESGVSLQEADIKIDNMLTMNSTKFIIQTFQSLLDKQKQQVFQAIDLNRKAKLSPKYGQTVSVTIGLMEAQINILQNLIQILTNFLEIYDGFMKYDDTIRLGNEEFFTVVYRWLTFFSGRPSDRQLVYSESMAICESELSKLDKYSKIKVPYESIVTKLSKVISNYESDFNPNFMLALCDFGQLYHTTGNKVQSFQDFQNELKYLLTQEIRKDIVRQALINFHEKNKKSDIPLQRMQQFWNSVQTIYRDDRMKSQKRLKKVGDFQEISEQTGQGHMQYWVKVCSAMTSALTRYFQDSEDSKLQPLQNYVDKIDEQARNFQNQEYQTFVTRFKEMLKVDHSLNKQ